MKSILVTGGAGFIGANFVPYFVNKRVPVIMGRANDEYATL